MKTFTFDNTTSDSFGLYINGRGVYNSPEPDLEYVTIPGRSGDLIYDKKRFSNINITYPACFTLSNFVSNFNDLKRFLLTHKGYYELTDDYQPNYFRMASIDTPPQPSNIDWVYDVGQCDITFNCKPQLFLASGKTTTQFTASGTITNPTAYASKPLLRVYGYGAFSAGGTTVTIASHNKTYLDIDCELMDCYKGSTNMNSYVTIGDKFPELASGSNNITITDNTITKIIVTPRWWTV